MASLNEELSCIIYQASQTVTLDLASCGRETLKWAVGINLALGKKLCRLRPCMIICLASETGTINQASCGHGTFYMVISILVAVNGFPVMAVEALMEVALISDMCCGMIQMV